MLEWVLNFDLLLSTLLVSLSCVHDLGANLVLLVDAEGLLLTVQNLVGDA